MPKVAKIRSAIYCVIALLALVFTWIHVPAYLGHGAIEGNKAFWIDALFNTNAAGKFLTVDVLFLALACSVWMYVEGRRIGMRFILGYVVLGAVIAISVAFPLFLAAREFRLANPAPSESVSGLNWVDYAVLVLLAAVTVGAGLGAAGIVAAG